MPGVNAFEFSCGCGKRFKVTPQHSGTTITCPVCNKPVTVPTIYAPPADTEVRPSRSVGEVARQAAVRLNLIGGPISFTTILSYLLLTWLIVCLSSLIVMLMGPTARIVGSILFAGTSITVAYHIFQLLKARQLVLRQDEVPLLGGMIRLVAWEPTEGILVLRNKNVIFSDDDLDDARGGIRFLCPVLGEEVGLRVPLETQTLDYLDQDVLTREYLSLTVRATLRWRITDIRSFYLLISRELRDVSDDAKLSNVHSDDPTARKEDRAARRIGTTAADINGPKGKLIGTATQWLRMLAEAQTRTVISKMSSGLLLADRLSQDMPELRTAGLLGSGVPMTEGSLSLAEALHSALNEGSNAYGITIVDVALREVRFPDEILKECIAAAKSAYLPLLGRRKAEAEVAVLQREAEVLGKEVIGTRELLSAAPNLALPDLMAQVLYKQGIGAGSGASGPPIVMRNQIKAEANDTSTPEQRDTKRRRKS